MTENHKILLILVVLALGGFTLGHYALSAEAATAIRDFHVTGQSIPAALGNPTVLEGGTTNTTVNLSSLVVSNKDTAIHNVTVQDCGSPPFILFNAYPIAASTSWFAPLGGVRFTGCLKWLATGLSGTDLVIDGALNTKVTSATHNFTLPDVGVTLTISAGTGFTVSTPTILSVGSNAATLSASAGTLGSTGGTWALPVVMGTVMGTR